MQGDAPPGITAVREHRGAANTGMSEGGMAPQHNTLQNATQLVVALVKTKFKLHPKQFILKLVQAG